jgi:hypothetical protein
MAAQKSSHCKCDMQLLHAFTNTLQSKCWGWLDIEGGQGCSAGICAVSVAGYIQQMVVARQSGCLFEVTGVGCRQPACALLQTRVDACVWQGKRSRPEAGGTTSA